MKQVLRIFAQRPVLVTIVVCILLYIVTGLTSDNFFTAYAAVNLFQNYAILGIVAAGMTFVILTGGIDLSVGSVLGWTTVMVGALVAAPNHWNPYLAIVTALAIATAGGGLCGYLIHKLEIPAFLLTLGGLFLYRGWALVISAGEIRAEDPRILQFSERLTRLPIEGKPPLYLYTVLFLVVIGVGSWLGRFTRFGRSLYAIGGSETSAVLMGLPVTRSKTLVYALSGFCASLAGVLSLVKDRHGSALQGRGLELDAIAVAVIGGTLLSGGIGGVPGTLVGLLTYAIIQTAMSYHTFPTGVDRIVIGGLLLAFILLQKVLQFSKRPAST